MLWQITNLVLESSNLSVEIGMVKSIKSVSEYEKFRLLVVRAYYYILSKNEQDNYSSG